MVMVMMMRMRKRSMMMAMTMGATRMNTGVTQSSVPMMSLRSQARTVQAQGGTRGSG